ncbi:tubulin-dependent ATPase kip3 [Malassezia caprae]|uniref:Kinesin-like protein n=1 Tax=Malassezia caprae TaxID=1381934 RepID=A0AAF0E609_9BASI|nr:tubulin-dependent ATPase kip3 [Malassezia caprae]
MTDSSIQVVVRIRPLNAKEIALLPRVDTSTAFQGDGGLAPSPSKGQSAIAAMRSHYIRNILAPVDDRVLVFDPVDPDSARAPSHMNFRGNGRRPRDVRYAFDRVYAPAARQRDVYSGTVEPMLAGLLNGFNASVFAYGATGCGKTHTISGTSEDPGLIFLTMQGLYARIEAESSEYETDVRLSYLEIYNETIRDLLSPEPTPPGPGLALREDAASKISVVGITEHTPASPEQVLEMITEGNQRRTQSPTEANAASSRSHAVLQINVTRRPRTAGTVEERCSASLNVIDLAGSERASATSNHGLRMKEGANINRSLLALGSCINALCQTGGARNVRGRHIPYRNSKLTRLLKFSLGGNCKTVMIACVSPSSAHYDETHNTLKYANQAKNIQTKVSRNLLHIDRHVAQYVQAIAQLRAEISELKEKLAQNSGAPMLSDGLAQVHEAQARLASAAATTRAAMEPCAAHTAAQALHAAAADYAAQAPTEAERAALASLQARCAPAAEKPRTAWPPLPLERPEAAAHDPACAALYDAVHACADAQLRADAETMQREALEQVLKTTVAPRLVQLVACTAHTTAALQAALPALVETDAHAALAAAAAQGAQVLEQVAGHTIPPSPAPAVHASPQRSVAATAASPARRLVRKSPRRRALRAPAPRASVGFASHAAPAARPRPSLAIAPRRASVAPSLAPRASVGARAEPASADPRKMVRPAPDRMRRPSRPPEPSEAPSRPVARASSGRAAPRVSVAPASRAALRASVAPSAEARPSRSMGAASAAPDVEASKAPPAEPAAASEAAPEAEAAPAALEPPAPRSAPPPASGGAPARRGLFQRQRRI